MFGPRVKASAAIILLIAGGFGFAGRGVVRATDPAGPQAPGEADRAALSELVRVLEKAPGEADKVALSEAMRKLVQAEHEALKATLLKLEESGYEALKGTDRDASFALLAPDFVAVMAGEGRMGRAEFLKVMARVTVTDYALSDVDLVRLTPAGDAATLTYRAKTSFTYDGKPARETLWVSSTWAKRGEKWTNVFYQETRND